MTNIQKLAYAVLLSAMEDLKKDKLHEDYIDAVRFIEDDIAVEQWAKLARVSETKVKEVLHGRLEESRNTLTA